MTFKQMKQKQTEHMNALFAAANGQMFVTDVDPLQLWDTYLMAFPEDIRQEHNCSACRHFIKRYGSMVAIVNNEKKTIWDFEVDDPFKLPFALMNEMVKAAHIKDLFLESFSKIGVDYNFQEKPDGQIIEWQHFHYKLPNVHVKPKKDIPTLQNNRRALVQVFERSLRELSLEAFVIVKELIDQNSLYRGADWKQIIKGFIDAKKVYDTLSEERKELFLWSYTHVGVMAIRNTSMGTLLIDLSEGLDVEDAVRKYEHVVAPANYKRPTAIVTKRMIDDAQAKIKELGYEQSLQRRHAKMDDITVDNVLFVNRDVKDNKSIFETLGEEQAISPKTFDRAERMSVEDFIEKVLPNAVTLEVLLEKHHIPNLCTLIAPQYKEAPSLFKWKNGMSWVYNNNMADSIREKVKQAGGNVVGSLRCSLEWYNFDDLDLHLTVPTHTRREEIYYGSKHSSTGGSLDVDMNAGSGTTRTPVENIVFPLTKPPYPGKYVLDVVQFSKRETIDVGFTVELEYGGTIYTYRYDKPVTGRTNVAIFTISKDGKLTFESSLPSSSSVNSEEVWGIKTYIFVPVKMMLLSPNHWESPGTGLKHYMFMLKGCVNPDSPRVFFNEFLKEELSVHRKVFELIGSKFTLSPVPSEEQMSGVGFTHKQELIVKVKGAFERIIRIMF